MIFQITRHAHQRLRERGIDDPNIARMSSVSKKMRRKIREACKVKGYNPEKYVYFRSGRKSVYVTVFLDVGKYLLITAFKLDN